ncbi:MAG: aminotransferase class V-fold PLP-dependent enzyme [Alphaproteobacteria bacterium]|nr:aminotransferase class V-fold PLP-dependent enzyme [Alphaproteobacteria bacterium]
MTDDVFTTARRDFPALEHSTYLDVSARGILSRTVRQALDWQLDDAMQTAGHKHLWMEHLEKTRTQFARLIHAEPDEVTFAKNVSEGLNMIATGLDWRAGDNVVVAAEAEHPNNIYCWLNLERRGVTLKTVPTRGGVIDTDAVIDAIDTRTRLVSVASQTFSPGLRTDMDAIGAACRARDVFFLVDGAQSVGILDTDVGRSNIDGLAVSTSKGLLGVYGMGFLYCRRAWAERLEPAYLARFGVDLDDAHEAEMGGFAYELAVGARRFDLGNYNFTGVYAAHASLERLLAIGTPAIERHVTALARRLADGMQQLGLPTFGREGGGRDHGTLGSIVCVGTLGGGHDSTEDQTMAELYRHLTAHDVKLSIRRGVLRFSFHLYNAAEDVERVLGLVAEKLGR